jgi:hypothetical protein
MPFDSTSHISGMNTCSEPLLGWCCARSLRTETSPRFWQHGPKIIFQYAIGAPDIVSHVEPFALCVRAFTAALDTLIAISFRRWALSFSALVCPTALAKCFLRTGESQSPRIILPTISKLPYDCRRSAVHVEKSSLCPRRTPGGGFPLLLKRTS